MTEVEDLKLKIKHLESEYSQERTIYFSSLTECFLAYLDATQPVLKQVQAEPQDAAKLMHLIEVGEKAKDFIKGRRALISHIGDIQ